MSTACGVARISTRRNKIAAVAPRFPYTSAMRKLSLFAIFLMASSCIASAQQSTPDQGPSWSRVEGLPSGVGISVKAKQHSGNCNFKSATETELTCVGDGAPMVYPRAEIKSVKLRHRGRSTLVGLAIGAGAGAAIGAPVGKSGSIIGHGAAAAIIAVPGAIIGAIVGATTDFTHTTVYRAP